MAPDPESPAAGGYCRILVPQKRRPASPAPAQLPGCVAGVVAPGAVAFDWEAGGSPVQRRLRSSSPKTCGLVAMGGDHGELRVIDRVFSMPPNVIQSHNVFGPRHAPTFSAVSDIAVVAG